MDRPDTILELHRGVVEELAAADFEPKAFPPEPIDSPDAQGDVHVAISLARVWFAHDGNGRAWAEPAATADAERERHFAFDLLLSGHPAATGLADSRVVLTSVLGLPAPTFPATDCQGTPVPANVIPLPGRITIHERLDRIDSTIDGDPGQNIVLDFADQPSPVLQSTPPASGVDSRLFGPGVTRAANGSVTLAGNDPRIVWELTRAEQLCVVNSTAGKLLVARRVLGGASQAAAEDAVLDSIAGDISEGVRKKLATAGDLGTSRKGILPADPLVAPDQAGVRVGPECVSGATAIEIDARVKRWVRPAGGAEEESLVFQLLTAADLPDDERLPESTLALRDVERVGFSRAGWAILRSLRCSQIKSLCLDAADFDPGEGCRLDHPVGITVGENDATLEHFRARIIPFPARPDEGLLEVKGRAEGGNWAYDWWMDFELEFELGRGEAPREARNGESPRPAGTLREIGEQIEALLGERCAGTRPRAEIDGEIDALQAQKKLGPTTMGIKPIEHDVSQSSDSSLTTAGLLAGIFLVGVATIITGGLAGWTAGTVFTVFVLGVAGTSGIYAALDAYVFDVMLADKVAAFVNDNRDPTGERVPLDGYEPIHVELRKVAGSQDGYALNAYLEQLPARMRVLWREPDAPKPQGDADFVTQWVAGKLPGEERIWMLTVHDAARYILNDRLTLTVGDPGPDEAEVHVSTSSRGRRYLRTDPDAGAGNNLAKLPPLPL